MDDDRKEKKQVSCFHEHELIKFCRIHRFECKNKYASQSENKELKPYIYESLSLFERM